ncbi:hypothetical protein ACRAKI_24855 [Saccharothrix isguenensis]
MRSPPANDSAPTTATATAGDAAVLSTAASAGPPIAAALNSNASCDVAQGRSVARRLDPRR